MRFDIDKLADSVAKACPRAVFALLHGSAKDGFVRAGADVDIAVYIEGKPDFEFYRRAYEAVSSVAGGVEPDVGILNRAEPVYRFEALKGRLLFSRDTEKYLDFFSLTCREYESQMVDYQRQWEYRKNRNQRPLAKLNRCN
jgi:predicted nucleotidyltransferase